TGLSGPEDSPRNHFLAGSTAGAIQCIVCCPIELVKTRMQLQGTGEKGRSRTRTYRNSLDCLRKIYRKEGVRGINRGLVCTLIRETPAFGLYFLTYDGVTRALGCEPEDPHLIPKLLVAGGMSGIASWLSTYPFDVVKSRLQADGFGSQARYRGIADCFAQSYREEGFRVFKRGLVSTLLRAFPVNAATFATVTLFLDYMRAGEKDEDLDGNARLPTAVTTATATHVSYLVQVFQEMAGQALVLVTARQLFAKDTVGSLTNGGTLV
uniref:Mitochondrial basic amino acids transporter n=1 Tax=Eptatretus burgeri TaxID=7764 RepID=A0A8C4R7T7_EPTBU